MTATTPKKTIVNYDNILKIAVMSHPIKNYKVFTVAERKAKVKSGRKWPLI